MDTPGNLLRSERERQKKSLEDIEKVLKINIAYLKAIEKDDYELLPAEVFTKSYLRSYSAILDLDGNHILDLYNKRFGTHPVKEPEPPKKRLREMLPSFKFNYKYLMAICIGLVTVSITAYIRHGSEKPVAAVPKVKTDITEINDAKAPEPARPLPAKELSLRIEATELTWIAIKIDSSVQEERILRAGETLDLTASEKFVLKIGNAGGTRLILNGSDIGPLGPHGQVADIVLPEKSVPANTGGADF